MTTLTVLKNNNALQASHPVFVRHLTSQTVRLLIDVILLFGVVVYQFQNPDFVNIDFILPLFGVLTLAFLAHGMTYAIAKLEGNIYADISLFALDLLVAFVFMVSVQSTGSILILLFLAQIVFAGINYGRRGAFLALFASLFLYSIALLAIVPEFSGQQILEVSINQVAFLAVAVLSGLLSEQVYDISEELAGTRQDVIELAELNTMIVENVASGILTVDHHFSVTHSNQSCFSILGLADQSEIDLKKQLPEVITAIQNHDFRSDGQNRRRIEVKYVHPKQHQQRDKLIVEVIISALFDSQREVRGYILALQDLTKEKNLEAKMRQQEKLAAVGQLAAGIAHEIRNPLASISGSIQLLDSSDSEDFENKKLMRIILKEIDRLNLLITEFLEYVRPEDMEKEAIHLSSLLHEVGDMVKVNKTLSEGVEQQLNLNSEKLVFANYAKMKQAILNIVINSYQACEGQEEKCVFIESFDESDSVVVRIRDTGVGIDDKLIERIFEPFHTTKSRGTGLGLAITHKIIESHQGEISVESEVGRGTSFILRFPATDDSHEGEAYQKLA